MSNPRPVKWCLALLVPLAVLFSPDLTQALQILTPNDGGDVPSGSIRGIFWGDPGTATSFDISYSKNNKSTWTRIAIGVTGNHFEWQVPKLGKNYPKCYIKVVGRNPRRQIVGSDLSDMPFAMTVVRFLAPSGKETYTSGENRTISWRQFEPRRSVATIVLQYSINNGSSWRRIATLADPTLREYPWVVPAHPGAKAKCLVQILLKDRAGKTICSAKSGRWSLNAATARPGTKAVDTETLSKLSSIGADGLLTFALGTSLLDGLVVGDILVFGESVPTPEGLLRKITAITRTATQLLAATEQASLGDVIGEGTVSYHGTLSPEDITARATRTLDGVSVAAGSSGDAARHAAATGLDTVKTTFTLNLSDFVLYDGDKNLATKDDQILANGLIAMGIDTDLKVDFGLIDGLRSVDFYAAPYQETSIEVTTNLVDFPGIDEKVIIYPATPLPPIHIPFPVVGDVIVVPVLTVYAGLKGDAAVNMTTGVRWYNQITAGVSYAKDAWTTYQNTSQGFEWTPPRIEAGLDLKIYIEPRVELKIYNVPGPRLNAQAYLKAAATFGACAETSLTAGINASSSFDLDILDIKRLQLHYNFGVLFEKEFPLYHDRYCAPAEVTSYTFLRKWGSRGSGAGKFVYPIWLALDSVGNVYVTEEGNNRVQKFSSEGVLLTKWGGQGSANGKFETPEGIAIDLADRVYVADKYNFRVEKFSSNGSFLGQWWADDSPDSFFTPMGLAIAPNGSIFVTDMDRAHVEVYAANGSYLWTLADSEWHGGDLQSAAGIAVDTAGNAYVADYYNNCVRKYDSSGALLRVWGSYGTDQGQFDGPLGLAVDRSGHLFVTDQMNHRVQKFDTDGNFVTTWGSNGSANGQFQWPAGVAVDARGNVYVSDPGNSRIQVFSPAP